MALYHFTDPRNIPSIKKYGLLSWRRLVDRGIIHFPASSELSRELDERKQLDDYVRLCLRPEHPMAYRAIHEDRVDGLVWLKVDRTVARFRSTLFSDRNAAATGAIINSDWATAFKSDDPQAEVLVEGFIGTKWIEFP